MDWSYLTLCTLNTNFSYTATILNIVAICVIMKTSSLSRNFKTLLLSLAVSDLGIGLLAQPMFVAYHAIWTQHKQMKPMKLTVSYTSWLLSQWISFFSHRFLVSWSYVQTDFWPFTFTPDTRTCDIQAYCCCCDLNLGDKCTYFTDQVIHPKKCHVCSLGWKTENYAKYPKISLIQLPSCLMSHLDR